MGVVNGHFGPESVAQLVVLLDLGALVVHVAAIGTTPSVRTRVRKRPGVRRLTRRSKIKLRPDRDGPDRGCSPNHLLEEDATGL